MATMLPHIMVLGIIRSTIEKLRKDNDLLNFILEGYAINCGMDMVYGPDFINPAIEYLKNSEMHYGIGYRLDVTRLPNISTTFEGGSEEKNFIGDYGETVVKQHVPTKYADFHISDIHEDGSVMISKEYQLQNKMWIGLSLKSKSGNFYKIKSMIWPTKPTDQHIHVYTDPVPTLEEGLNDWSVWSAERVVTREIGQSLDRCTVKVYLDVPGDPEACDVFSCIVRHALKQSRMVLADNGFNVATFRYTPIAKNESYVGQTVWTTEFSINGLMTDEWVMNEALMPDRLTVRVVCDRNLEGVSYGTAQEAEIRCF